MHAVRDDQPAGRGSDSSDHTALPREHLTAGNGPASRGRPARSQVKALLAVVVGVGVVAILLHVLEGQMFAVSSKSMESTLRIGDRVALREVAFSRGDVVVFEDPGGWLQDESAGGDPLDQPPGYLIGRVLGMPGDRVRCCDGEGRITVNDHALHETDYLYAPSRRRPSQPLRRPVRGRSTSEPHLRDG